MKPGDIGLEKRSKKHISLWKLHQIHFHPPSTLEPSCQSKWPHRLMSPFASIKNFTCCWSSAFPEKITTLRLPKPALKGVDQKTPLQNEEQRPPFAEFRTLFPIAILAKRPSAGAWRGYSFEDLYALYIKIPSFTSISDPSCHQLELLNRSEARRHHHIHHDLHQLDVQSTSESLALELKTSGVMEVWGLGASIMRYP